MFPMLVLCIFVSRSVASLEPIFEGGGSDADINDFPFIVSLQTTRHFCGGSIYNRRYIVTAAHCVRAVASPTDIKIRYGSSYHAEGGTLIGVVAARVHPKYKSKTIENDIALLKTSEPIILKADGGNASITRYSLDEPENDVPATIIGWSTMQSDSLNIPSQLQKADVRIISNAVCNSTQYGYGGKILAPMICAGAPGIDSCRGDSGGPMLVNNAQVGVMSWGWGCADPYYPIVYSSVARLRNFLITFVNKL